MPTIRATSPVAQTTTSSFGNAVAIDGKANVTTNFTTADEIVLDVPAGFRLQELLYRNGDLDSGAALQFSLGYRSTHPDQTMPASPTYFLSGSTALQAAQNNWVSLAFEPVTFSESAQIVLKPTTSAAGLAAAASVSFLAKGILVGPR